MTTERFGESQGYEPPEVVQGANYRHVSSRMLENYLTDVEYLIRERMWTEALPLALALPHLCVALADPDLRSSRERFVAWCEQWLYPTFSEALRPAPTADELYALSRERAGFDELEATGGVPGAALKRLRLRRLARPSPLRRRSISTEIPSASDDPTHNVCIYIVHAVNRWYDEWAAFDSTAQTNLARLAVLR